MRLRLATASLCAALLAARSAEAAVVDLELDSLGTYTTDLFAACAMGAVTETSSGLLSFGPLGLGVASPSGGLSAYLDGSENLTFFFSTFDQVGVTQVTYRVQSAGNQNGTGSPGEAFLEARGANNVDLGIRSVSGTGTIDVSALYGGVPITRIEITAAGDSQRVDRIGFTVAPDAAFSVVSLQGFPVLQVVEYDICDLFLSGSHPIRLAPVGLGVASANPPSLLDSTIEGSEFARFEFATPFSQVGYTNEAIADGNANGTLGEAFVEAFGASGASLGVVAVSGEGQQVVSELFDPPISAFRVIANADSQRILTVLYGPEPDALAIGLAALAALGLARARRDAPPRA